MGILSRFFGRDPKPSPEGSQPSIRGDGTFKLPIVGEASYQDNLSAICGPKTTEGENRVVEATLVYEDSNPYDAKAIRVDIAGRTVGYLSRENARTYRDAMTSAGAAGRQATCAARIRGGWRRGRSEGHYGVWLDIRIVQDE